MKITDKMLCQRAAEVHGIWLDTMLKKVWKICLVFLLISLVGCSAVHTVTKEGVDYVIDTQACTISDGTHTYEYTFQGNSSSARIHISYPNGAVYSWQTHNHVGYGGWTDNYDEALYADGDILCDVILEQALKPNMGLKIVVAVFLGAFGIFCIRSPETVWHLENAWKFKNAEPSELSLAVTRISGGVCILIAVVLIFVTF